MAVQIASKSIPVGPELTAAFAITVLLVCRYMHYCPMRQGVKYRAIYCMCEVQGYILHVAMHSSESNIQCYTCMCMYLLLRDICILFHMKGVKVHVHIHLQYIYTVHVLETAVRS